MEVTHENGNTLITLQTRLDSSTAGAFDELLKKEVPQTTGTLTLDFQNVDFISSIGLRVLVSAYHALSSKQMIIKDANSSVKEIFRLSGLQSVFTLQ